MGIFSKKYESTPTTTVYNELRELVQTIGTKVAILESRIEGISANVASIRGRLNRNAARDEDLDRTGEEEFESGVKTENINNPVLLPEDGIVRKNSKRR